MAAVVAAEEPEKGGKEHAGHGNHQRETARKGRRPWPWKSPQCAL